MARRPHTLRHDVLYFCQLSRPLNVLLSLLTFALAAYISALHTFAFLDVPEFWYEAGLMTLIMAAGYWINDVYDFRIDLINRPERVIVGPHLSAKKVLTGYFVVTLLAALASLWLPLKFVLLNFGAMLALYLYARYFKRTSGLGNLVVSTLTAMVVLAGAFVVYLKMALVWGMVFAFLLNLIREITKDVEDLPGDLAHGLRTLPVVMSLGQTRTLLLGLYLLLLVALNLPMPFYQTVYQTFPAEYLYTSLFLVQLPALYLMYHVLTARVPADFRTQSQLLKAMMFGGLLTLLTLPS